MTAPAAFEIWLQRAKSNLKIARMGKREGVFLEDLCFEAQQAAEKVMTCYAPIWKWQSE